MSTANAGVDRTTTAGILFMAAAIAFLCVSDAIAKTLTAHYPPLQILFLRNIIALPFSVLIAWKAGGPAALRSHRPAMHLFRGLIWIAAAGTFFTGLKYLGLAEATVLAFAAPVFITALAALVLKDPVGWRRWSAVLVGFVGVLVVVRPGLDAFQMVSLFPVATAVLYAVLMLSARFVDPRESVWTLMLYLVGGGAVVSALTMPFVWVPVRPEDSWLFLGIAFFGTIGVTMLTQAFRLAPAATVAPLDYTALIWATLFGWLVWGEIPDLATYIGAAIIIASGIFIIWRERKLEG